MKNMGAGFIRYRYLVLWEGQPEEQSDEKGNQDEIEMSSCSPRNMLK